MAINAEIAREKAIAAAATKAAATKPVTTGSNYGAFSELPLYQYNTGPGSSQQYVAPTSPTGPTGPTLTTEQLLAQQQAKLAAEQALANRKSAYDLLLSEFTQYGLGSLVEGIKGLVQENISPSEFSIRLRQTPEYQKRFAANAARIKNGLSALSEGAYIALEDQYQSLMRNYGLPPSYYAKDSMGTQVGFEKFIEGDVSPGELEDRIATAQNRVVNAPPMVKEALKQFYPDIKDADILAYTLDPTKGLSEIKRKVTAAEIGGAALGQGLGTSASRAEELARFGVNAESARAGFGAIGGGLERGSQLASIYQQQPYTQTLAEEEVFNLPGQTGAEKKRKKIIGLEQAEFAGQTGATSGALGRDRAGSF